MTQRDAGEIVQREGKIWRDFGKARVFKDLFSAGSIFFSGLEQENDAATGHRQVIGVS